MNSKSQFLFALAIFFTTAGYAAERDLFAQVYGGAEKAERPYQEGFELRATKIAEKGTDIQGKTKIVDWPVSGENRVVQGPVAKVQVTKAKQGGWVYGKTKWEIDFTPKGLKDRSKQVYEFYTTTHRISDDGAGRVLTGKEFLFVVERIDTGVNVKLLKKDETLGDRNVSAYDGIGEKTVDEKTSADEFAKKFGDESLSAQVVSVGKDSDTITLKFYYSGGFVPDKQVGWEEEKEIKKMSASYRQDEEMIKIEPFDLPVSQSFRLMVSLYGGVYEE